MTGKVISKSGNMIEIKTEYADKVVIKWDAVKSLKSTIPMTITLEDKQELTGLADFSKDGAMVINSASVYDSHAIDLIKYQILIEKYFQFL